MAMIDKTREEISWMKLLFAIFSAAYISLAAFVLKSPGEYMSVLANMTGESFLSDVPKFWVVIVALTPLLFIAVLLLTLAHSITRRIRELGET